MQDIPTEEILPSAVNMEDTLENSIAENIGDGNAKNYNFDMKELNSFQERLAKIASNFYKLKKTIFTSNYKNDNENAGLAIFLLKVGLGYLKGNSGKWTVLGQLKKNSKKIFVVKISLKS